MQACGGMSCWLLGWELTVALCKGGLTGSQRFDAVEVSVGINVAETDPAFIGSIAS